MNCEKCGNELGENAVFCALCGNTVTKREEARQSDASPFAAQPSETAAAQSALFQNPVRKAENAPQPQPTAPKPHGYFLTTEQIARLRADERARAMKYADEQSKNEKTFFGSGALIACMTAIAVLSVACGIFAGLYFSVT